MFSWLRKKNNLSSPEYRFRNSRKEASEDYVKNGEDQANGNRPEEALEYFDNAIMILPTNDFAWGDKGLILEKLGRPDED